MSADTPAGPDRGAVSGRRGSDAAAAAARRWPRGAVDRIEQHSERLHAGAARVVFHDWPHVCFVRDTAVELAELNGADPQLVRVAAVVHDLNYLVGPGTDVDAGRILRRQILAGAGLPDEDIVAVEHIIWQADLGTRSSAEAADMVVRLEAQALSDADVIYKILPFTPVLYAEQYMRENDIAMGEMAQKILAEQLPLLRAGTLFFSPDLPSYYQWWAESNLDLWRCIAEALPQPRVQELLRARAATAALLDRPDSRDVPAARRTDGTAAEQGDGQR